MQESRKALLIPINSREQLLIQDRTGHKPPAYGFFGGEIEKNETPLEALIRETKEELDLSITEGDVIFLGMVESMWDEVKLTRHLYLYKTEQETFTVLEGKGAEWLTLEEASVRLDIGERFEQITGMIHSAQNKTHA